MDEAPRAFDAGHEGKLANCRQFANSQGVFQMTPANAVQSIRCSLEGVA